MTSSGTGTTPEPKKPQGDDTTAATAPQVGPIAGSSRRPVARPRPSTPVSTTPSAPTASNTSAPTSSGSPRPMSQKAADGAKTTGKELGKAVLASAGVPSVDAAMHAADVGDAAKDGATQDPEAGGKRRRQEFDQPAGTQDRVLGSLRGGRRRAAGSPTGAAQTPETGKSDDGQPSMKDDAKNIGAEIAKGAAQGGYAGAAKGALTGMAKSKRGRKIMVLSVASFLLPPLLILALVLGVMSTFGSNVSVDASAQNARSLSGMTEDGVPFSFINVAAGASKEESVRFEITTAAAFHSGADLENPTEYSAQERKDAIDNDEPIGPYAFIYNDANKIWTEDLKRPDLDFDDLTDVDSATRIYADLAEYFATREGFDERDLDMSAGVESTADEEDPALDAYQVGEGKEDIEAAAQVRDNWDSVLASMPTKGAESNSQAVYDTAFTWFLGRPSACLPGGQVGITGTWTNPLPGSPAPDSEQDFGVRSIGQGNHDGVDLNGAAEGSPIVAASSGIASVEPSSIYGPNWVKIDHGGGIETWYGHMVSTTVTTGQQVQPGEQIGVEGNEGNSFGIHLHFSTLENGEFVDPVPFMAARGVNLFGPAGSVPVSTVPGTPPTAPPSQVGADEVRIAQVNIKTSLPYNLYKADLDKALSLGPDFISLNEVNSRTPEQITPPGYASWRDVAVEPASQSRGTAVVWRTDRWTVVDKGRVQTSSSPVALDNRWAHWVTLTSTGGQTVSFIATHQMTNPRLFGGPRRQERREKYRAAMEILNTLTTTLGATGPVFAAGDFNSRAADDDPWGPEVMLAKSGLQSSYDALGARIGVVDYIFAQPGAGVTALRQGDFALNSDHPGLWADYKMGAFTGNVSPIGLLPESWTGTSSDGESVTLDSTQLGFAQTIASKGAEMAVPDAGVIVAFMTVLVETKFKNYASTVYPETIGKEYPSGAVGSDHDSVGLFQQRPQSGWGEPLELLDPAYTASAFFGGPSGPNGGSPAGLLGQPTGWETRDKGDVAQSVQGSAHPERYAKWEQAATELFALVKNSMSTSSNACGGTAPAFGQVPSEYNLGASTPATVNAANVLGPMFGIAVIGGQSDSGHTTTSCHYSGEALDLMVEVDSTGIASAAGKAQGDALAEYAKANATSLQIASVIWYNRIWSAAQASAGWRQYSHPSGNPNPTLQHMDHVHLSIQPCQN